MDKFYTLDRIEEESLAVLVSDTGETAVLPLTYLKNARVGDVFTLNGERAEPCAEETLRRREASLQRYRQFILKHKDKKQE